MLSFWPLLIAFVAFDLWFAYDGFLNRDPGMLEHATFNQIMTGICAIPVVFLGMHVLDGMANRATSSDSQIQLPDCENRWSWGAFGMAPFWAIGNRVYWGLPAVIPIVGIAFAIALGLRGHRLARQSYPWRDEEEFKRAQRIWTRWGIGGLIFQVLFAILLGSSGA